MNNLEILQNLISIKSNLENGDTTEIVDYITSILDDNNIEYLKVKNETGAGVNIIAGVNCGLENIENAIILSGHMDTVSTNSAQWSFRPYTLKKDGDYLYGLGVCDMKNFLANILASIEELKNVSTSRPLVLCFTSDEETVMYGIKAVVRMLKELNIKPTFTLIGEPSCGRVCDCNKGFYEYEVEVVGKACHSSNPKQGINSIVIMAEIIAELNKLSSEFSDATTMNIGVIKGGDLCNIVPANCKLRYEMRTFISSDVQKVQNAMKEFYEKLKQKYEGCKINSNLVFEIPAFEKIESEDTLRIKEYLKDDGVPYKAATEAGFFEMLGTKALIYGAGDIKYAHSANEMLSLTEFNNYREQLIDIVKILNN